MKEVLKDKYIFIMKQEDELKQLLIKQKFEEVEYDEFLLESAKECACRFVQMTEGVAVVSDFHNNICYIYAGKFGQSFFNLPNYMKENDTAFENMIFDRVIEEDLLDRHILELSFFNYLKNMPPKKKSEYQASCLLRLYNHNQTEFVQILHTTRYLNCLPNGSVWCGLCTYSPFPHMSVGSGIINTFTGKTVCKEEYQQCYSKLLSKRQKEILGFLAKGYGSKQIADSLNLSVNTVNRHRQDILLALRVTNTAAAVEIGVRMGLI